MFKIIEKFELGPKMYYCRVDAPLIAKKARAGQFVVIRLDEKGERVPLTIADNDPTEGSITMVFQSLGKSTSRLAELKTGDRIRDILGPQGMPTEIETFGNVVVIGGGIGIAPVFPLARALTKKDNKVTSIIGYRAKEYVFWEDRMRSVSDTVYIATNDGSYGKKGFVTDVLRELMDRGEKIDRVFAIGPTVMMKAVVDVTRSAKIPTIVSLNSLMVCGMGMCGACRATVGGKTKFTCMDGPDFDGHQVDFAELMKRLDTYKHEEKITP